MNHYALFIKLMGKKTSNEILSILERWFDISVTGVKWNGHVSHLFPLLAGVRQVGVLSPFLFAVFIHSVVDKIKSTGVGCYYSAACVSVILYADDILLLSPSVSSLQALLDACEDELTHLDMQINGKKSTCIRFGVRFNADCVNLSLSQGSSLEWSSQCRGTSVYILLVDEFLDAQLIIPRVSSS